MLLNPILTLVLSEVTKEVHVAHDDYDDYLKPESMIQAYLRGTVIETKRSYAHIESFALTKPSIKIEVSNQAQIVLYYIFHHFCFQSC